MTDQKALPFTGERFTPECDGGIWYEHWHRYVFVASLAQGRRVLDAACGEGYGSALLAQSAKSVVGVDLSEDAIGHARGRYGGRANLSFQACKVTAIPVDSQSVDLIVSFETIEHLAEQEEMLREFRRILRPGGLLVLSSPNRPVYSDENNYRNEYHVREMDRGELANLVSAVFPRCAWYGQRLLFHSVIWAEDASSASAPHQLCSLENGQAISTANPAEAMYFLLFCGDDGTVLPDPVAFSLFADARQSVYREYAFLMRQQWELKDEIAQLASDLARLREHAGSSADEQERLKTELADKINESRATASRADALRNDLARAETALTQVDARLKFRESWAGWLRFPLARLRRWFAGGGEDA